MTLARMAGTSLLYRAAVGLAGLVAPAGAAVDAKFRRGHRGRLGALARFEAWARAHREAGRPLAWFHAPSVGEGLQADAVLRRLRRSHPEWQLAYSFFSPSAEHFAGRLDVDVADYLPYDRPATATALLDALGPTVLVFSKLDLWPELACRAAGLGVPVALIAATVRPGSGRLRWPARTLLAPGYRAVAAAGAVSREDAERLSALGVPRSRISVTGDPRFDSVLDKVGGVAPDDPLLRFGAGAPTMVAGSTWPGDEDALLAGFARLHRRHPEARLILVPHEPTDDHLASIERRAAELGAPDPVRLSAAQGPVALLLVDKVGVLAALYGAGTLAYVGGGFHAAGLHSVLEPAAWGRPVVFGPRWRESRDAGLLLAGGGAVALEERGPTETVEELCGIWERWLTDERERSERGGRALAVVRSGAGAADRSAALVEQLVAGPRAP
jgi:3-deoxy-D-manno-octulosonic-acid transferase